MNNYEYTYFQVYNKQCPDGSWKENAGWNNYGEIIEIFWPRAIVLERESVIISYLLSCNCKSLAIAAAFYERLKRLPASARLISMDPLASSAIVLSQS